VRYLIIPEQEGNNRKEDGMSGQTNNSGVTGEQIRLLETQLALAFNEKIELAYAESYEESDVYYAPVRVPGVFSYAIKEAYVRAVFCRAFDDPDVIVARIRLSYERYRGSKGRDLGIATLWPEKTGWELAWEKDED
jgi:hypothetical protein